MIGEKYILNHLVGEKSKYGWNKELWERPGGFKEKGKTPFLKIKDRNLSQFGWQTQKRRTLPRKYARKENYKIYHLGINEDVDSIDNLISARREPMDLVHGREESMFPKCISNSLWSQKFNFFVVYLDFDRLIGYMKQAKNCRKNSVRVHFGYLVE